MIINLQVFFNIFLIIFVILWIFYSMRPCRENQKQVILTEQIPNTKSSSEKPPNIDLTWVKQFRQRELKIHSQNGEDGVVLWIFANIGTVNRPPRFVEFGTENGVQCNTRFLRQYMGWQGLMMDGGHENLNINLHKEMISAKNINDLLTKYQTPTLVDILVIDVDFDDYFIWKSILQANRYHARVVIIEYNYDIPPNENRVVDPYQDSRRWTGTTHYGAGILAMAALGRAHNYTLVYAEKLGVNLFFIQTSILTKQGVLDQVQTVEQLHVAKPSPYWRHTLETDQTRRWIWNDTVWK